MASKDKVSLSPTSQTTTSTAEENFICGINRARLYKGLNDSQRQPNSDLAQWTDDQEVMSSNPTVDNF